MLLRHLPQESSTVRELGGERLEWSIDTHLLATIVDVLNAANWQRGGNPRATKPKPIERPGQSTGQQMGTALMASEWDERRARRLERGESDSG